MGGRVKFTSLTKKKGVQMGQAINSEIRARKLTWEFKEYNKEFREGTDPKQLPITKKKAILKSHEARQRVDKNPM
eukprot:CAMPEP_0202018578 /NCGR_PEP_ID=MMETSP0905-20130828/39867_1 /ASSEMBLY_ACC=CAM_ASM_000554 /TAXON_ID=420261 /ORGANISM="Thalassiosira antarctica, Strain CCMP982" /LENGTH=74 /DNA_ID=CAMNT_0048579569 /DNA_START=311 /DNA_END=532 /DNA_ORIENTATION=-